MPGVGLDLLDVDRLERGGFAFLEVEVVATGEAPEVRLTGAAAARARELGARPLVSLTHIDATAGAGAGAMLAPGE